MLVSVIVPVYNGKAHLARTLAAIAASNYLEKELIVVDDASTDSSVEIARDFADLVIENKTRQAPGSARNRGAVNSRGDILFFVDADVEISPDTISKIAREMETHPEVSAIFGSYDDEPFFKDFFSQYKNLSHHFIHQHSCEEATTFWAGCGAVRQEIFKKTGGFPQDYKTSCIEDVVLGYKIRECGGSIRLLKDLQVKHLKKWSFWNLLKTDIFQRAIPWTRLAVQKGLPSDLNFKFADRLSVVCAWGLLLSLGLCFWQSGLGIFGLIFAGLLIYLNRSLYLFFLNKRGLFFTLAAVFFHWFYYLYSSFFFLVIFSVTALRHRRQK